MDNRLPQVCMQGSSHPPIGLYVHVPFCVRKCAYCDFTSYAGREADVPRYVDAVVREIGRRGTETGRPTADTIFIGGGTPSLLDDGQVTRILDALREAFAIDDGAEITCECNPGTLTATFAQALRKAGVNRLSLGAQARQTQLLRLIGRIHDWQQVIASVEIARQAGFDNINLDLMFGLPGSGCNPRKAVILSAAKNLVRSSGSSEILRCAQNDRPPANGCGLPSQTLADLRETLEAAMALSPTHVSCYGLIVEEGTPLCRDMAAGKLALPDEQIERDMYELARQTLAEHGFQQYEISNFAREGCECRHNIACWTRVPYLGFGCAAHSFFDECRTANPSSLDAYLAALCSVSGYEPKTERLSKAEARFESLMLGLRMTRGVKDEDFTRMHGLSIGEAFAEKLDKPIAAGLLEWHEGALRLTRLGMDLQNGVLVDLM
jgi:oxygen-independent coproporphyrinogen III oxidase